MTTDNARPTRAAIDVPRSHRSIVPKIAVSRYALIGTLTAMLSGIAQGAVAAPVVVIVGCGTTLADGETGVLSADLDCSASSGPGVTVGAGGTLNLSGFSLIGNLSAAEADGVICTSSCSVVGPGIIRDFGRDGVSAGGTALVRDATIDGCARTGVRADTATISGATISHSGSQAVSANQSVSVVSSSFVDNASAIGVDSSVDDLKKGTATVIHSTISGGGGVLAGASARIVDSTLENGPGLWADRISVDSSTIRNCDVAVRAASAKVTDSTISDCATAIDAYYYHFHEPRGKVRVSNSILTHNGDGIISSYKVRASGSTISENGWVGIAGNQISLQDCSVDDNGWTGIVAQDDNGWSRHYAARVSVKGCHITGNGSGGILSWTLLSATDSTIINNHNSASCSVGPIIGPCADLNSWKKKPRLVSTTCETSSDAFYDTQWHVCSLDAP